MDVFNLLPIACPSSSSHWPPLLSALQTLSRHVFSYRLKSVHMIEEPGTIGVWPQFSAVKCTPQKWRGSWCHWSEKEVCSGVLEMMGTFASEVHSWPEMKY